MRSSSGRPLPRVLLLDWDGTVRDSIGTIVGCARAALQAHGHDADAATIRATVGLTLDSSIRRWLPQGDLELWRRIQASYRDLWIETWHARAELFPGVHEALAELHRRGHWLAVATGKSRVGLERDLSTLPSEVRALFVATRTADETQSKPSPEMVFELLDELGARPEEALVVGDSRHDLEMARNAGCDAVGVLSGAGDRDELVGFGAVAVLGSLADLPRWLDSASS